MRKILLASALALSVVPSYAQQLPEDLRPKDVDGYLCEGTLNIDKKPTKVLVRARQTSQGQYVIFVGNKHPYPFRTLEEAWPYAEAVDARQAIFTVTGDTLGDDPADFATIFGVNGTYRATKSWNPRKNASEIGKDEIGMFNDVVNILKKCAQ